ncbi:bifunctional DNA primase/polymerase [Mycolicibacterium sp. S2-37]|uniref:phage/plasmid primase, P4 family n=1 Tax=Mycolicibacterium sp. S2-37 TaxID=2810297 RepID=UPI001A94B514|nr:phage/plasmid primase, P4 family [Mycolicibacterium sp. S2-37]MBO0680343.1 bifunctional DNA primase/polymerase [Mycolicibacterium sp. S2-37]
MTAAASIDNLLTEVYQHLDLRTAAHRWADDDYRVLPVDRQTKRPLIRHGVHDATTDHEQIDLWWDQHPRANVAVAVPDDQVVVDVDAYHGGLETIVGLLAKHGPLPPTKFHVTGGDDGTGTSTHDFFTVEPAARERIKQSSLGTGVDIRVGGKGYVVVHGLHASGRCYVNMTPGVVAAPLPHEWYALIAPEPKSVTSQQEWHDDSASLDNPWLRAKVQNELHLLATCPEGGGRWGSRNQELNNVALNLATYRRIDREWLRGQLISAMESNGYAATDGLHKIEGTINSAFGAADAKPAGKVQPPSQHVGDAAQIDDPYAGSSTASPTPPPGGNPQPLRGQLRQAELLAQEKRDELVHVHGLGWFFWDGQRWAADDRGMCKQGIYEVLRDQWRHAFANPELARELKQCSSATAVRGIAELAAALPEFAATVDDLDADPHLLNVANGTLDLHTGELRPHDPADRLTKVCRGAYHPAASAPRWDAFLARVLPDAAVRGFVQRLFGMALMGEVREHVLPIFTGTGRNGKSVSYKALLFAMGDYAATADPELFMSREGAHPTGEMDLMGRRLVVVSESNKDRRLDEAKMKRLVGGDPIKARYMRKDFVEFMPAHTAVLVTNHLPRVSGDDPATWARIRVIPFDVVIPPHEQDPGLDAKLELEADGILAWAVTGLRDYLDRGLDEPTSVRSATDTYHRDSDAVSRFIADCCEVGANRSATTAELHQAWVAWQQDDGCDPMGLLNFGKAIDAKGFTAKRTRRGAERFGIGIKPPATEFDENSLSSVGTSKEESWDRGNQQDSGDDCDELSGSAHTRAHMTTHSGESPHSSHAVPGGIRVHGPGRCPDCSFHTPTQGHSADCPQKGKP